MADNSSGQRTEKPTPKRLRDARRKGQIPRSPDLVGWIAVLVATYVLPTVVTMLQARYLGWFRTTSEALAAREWPLALAGTRDLVTSIGIVFVPFLFLLVLVVIVAMVAQGGVTLTAEPLRPKFERISPKAGLKRLVSTQSAVDTAKAVLRLVVLAVLMWRITRSEVGQFLGGSRRSPSASGLEVAAALILLVRLAALLGVVVGLGDYAYQRWKVGRQLRMTKEEVKRENRNTEGDPFIRGRRRAMHARVGRNKMLAAVGESSVVVVNPTHISVALSYEAGTVPTVVAKGEDELALRMRERAFEAGVPVVESRPLARALNELIEVGEEVPAHLYEAVAIVIAFVMRLPKSAVGRTVRRVSVPLSKLVPDHAADPGDGTGGRDGGGPGRDGRLPGQRRRRRPIRSG